MLGHKFKEGESERSACYPKRLNLPDDDPEAMVSLCKIIHYRYECTNFVTGCPSPQLSM